MVIFAALKRKWDSLMQVIKLHSALSQSNIKIHNLRRAGDGRYLVRVSVAPKGIAVPTQNRAPFANAGLLSAVSGSRIMNEDDIRFAEYFEQAMSGSDLMVADGEETSLAPYIDFPADRQITTRKNADNGLKSMLRTLGCRVDEAEIVSDAGYGTNWIAVAFSPA